MGAPSRKWVMESGEKESEARSEARSGWTNDDDVEILLGGLRGSLSAGMEVEDDVVVMVEYYEVGWF